jgi:hypothetical protein
MRLVLAELSGEYRPFLDAKAIRPSQKRVLVIMRQDGRADLERGVEKSLERLDDWRAIAQQLRKTTRELTARSGTLV